MGIQLKKIIESLYKYNFTCIENDHINIWRKLMVICFWNTTTYKITLEIVIVIIDIVPKF